MKAQKRPYVYEQDEHLIRLFPQLRLNSLKPCWFNELHQKNLMKSSAGSIAEDFFSKDLLNKIQSNDPTHYDYLIQCANSIKRNYKKFRIGRLLKDTLPKHDSVTPKKAIRCNLAEGQCRTLLIRALNLVFKRGIATNQQIYKFVCLLMKILFSYAPNRTPTVVELNWMRQLTRMELLLTRNIPSKFRRHFGTQCILYLMSFCCNILSHCFYITLAKSSTNTPITMYQRSLWNKIQAYSFKNLSVRQGLQEVELNVNKPVNRLKLLPKPKGVRPIGVAIKKFNAKDVGNARLMLNYLCEKVFPENPRIKSLATFRREFPNLIKGSIEQGKTTPNSFLYYCTGDLLDCYNKIDYAVLAKFLDIVPLDEDYFIATRASSKRNICYIDYGIGKSEEDARNHFQSKIMKNSFNFDLKYTKVSGYELRRLIRDYAVKPQVYFAGKYYVFSRGVLQGSPLSGILNDIYLLSAERQIFGSYKRGKLIYRRYVDDYVLFSNNQAVVTSVIVKLMDGNIRLKSANPSAVASIPRFGCSKVTTNFGNKILNRFSLQKSKFLPFCGSMIDSRRNLLLVDYEKYKYRPEKTPTAQRIMLSRRLSAVRKRFIVSIKHSVKFFLKQFVNSYTSMKQKDRLRQKRRFLSFIFDGVLLTKAAKFNLNIRKKQVRTFLRYQLKFITRKLNSTIKRIRISQ